MEKLIWDVEKLLENKTHEQHLEEIEKLAIKIEGYKEIKLGAKELLEIIEYDNLLTDKLGIMFQYYFLKTSVNCDDSVSDSKIKELETYNTEIGIRLAFWCHWFKDISNEEAKEIMDNQILKQYKYYLSEVRKYKKHTKSEEIEKLLSYSSGASENFSNIFNKLTTKFQYKWKGVEANEDEIRCFFYSDKGKIRKKAYKKILNKYSDNSTVLNEIYQSIIKHNNNMTVKVRDYDSAIQNQNLSNEVSDVVVNSLFSTVQKNVNVFQDFFKLKHKINDKSYNYSRTHLYAPIKYKLEKNYTLDEVLNIVYEVFRNFDPEFETIAKNIIKDNNIHSPAQKNKQGGAFCASVPNFNPFILMNFDDGLDSIYTLAHELGHAIHFVLMKDQPNALRNASLNLCECASTFCENLLFEYLYANSKNKKDKISLLSDSLDGHYATIQRQTYFSIFENYVHENIDKGLKKEDIEDKYYSLLKEQFGDMKIPKMFKNEFYYIPHIYNSPFYCYSYSFGELLVLSLYEQFKKEGEPFKSKYKAILSKGSSESPEEIIKGAGLNLSDTNFWKLGYDVISGKVEKLKGLL